MRPRSFASLVSQDDGDADGSDDNRRMSCTTLGLVLVAELLHALWNVVAKRTGGDARSALIAGGVGALALE